MLPQAYVDEVKGKTDILELTSRYVELKKMSEDIWQGKCPHPDHNDDTPSFTVNIRTQSWCCYGCHHGKKDIAKKGKDGKPLTLPSSTNKNYGSDCFAFIQWISKGKTSWPQAVDALAKEAGVPKPNSENDRLYKHKKLLAESYIKSLHGQPFNYLLDRGLNRIDMTNWGIGFDGAKITFPLYDRYRNVLGFTKRWLGAVPEGRSDKYKNSANSKVFNKSYYLYGIHLLDDECDEIRITEGALDVILPAKYGVKNICATLGTAFTEGHVEIMQNLGKIPVFCMDGDPAGLKAIKKSIDMLAANNIYCKILILPDGWDMADLANYYKEDTEQYIQDNSVTYGHYKVQGIISQYEAKLNELKLKLYPQLKQLLSEIPHEDERQVIGEYIKSVMQLSIT